MSADLLTMSQLTRIAAEAAHWMALVPLAVVAWQWWQARAPDPAFWWLGIAFAVSWAADTAAHWWRLPMAVFVYVITQSALVGAVFLPRKEAARFLLALCVVAAIAVLVPGPGGKDVLLHTVAWLSVACLAAEQSLGRLRDALVAYFGLGAVLYLLYAGWPGWTTWGLYQATRVAGIGMFCTAVLRPLPSLRVIRSMHRERYA